MQLIYVGIDEAGRGPLVGDMIVSGVVTTPDILEELRGKGLDDSKRLSRNKRYAIYREALKRGVVVVAVFVHPWRIDRENINGIEEKCIEWILRVVRDLGGSAVEDLRVYVDEVRGREAGLRKATETLFGSLRVEFRMEAGADAKYPPVMLASVFAKVMRDLSLLELKRWFGNFGSGYPVDPSTKRWILENYGLGSGPPLFVRRSWRILKRVAPAWYREKRRSTVHKSLLDYAKR